MTILGVLCRVVLGGALVVGALPAFAEGKSENVTIRNDYDRWSCSTMRSALRRTLDEAEEAKDNIKDYANLAKAEGKKIRALNTQVAALEKKINKADGNAAKRPFKADLRKAKAELRKTSKHRTE